MEREELAALATAGMEMLVDLTESLSRIERHMGVLAEYAEMLRIQATGEKVYEVASYVVSTTSQGDRCVYLYATHPGLQYRVCTVYEERLNELPFAIPATAKIWDGEAAPSREGAARKGYIMAAPAPFKVSLLPTGGTTDAGLPIHKFSRVIGEAAPEAKDEAPAPKPKPTARPAQEAKDRGVEEPPIVLTGEIAANSGKVGGGWPPAPDFDKEFDGIPTHPASAHQPAAQANGAGAALPFKDQGTAVKWALDQGAHYRKADGTPDYPHVVGSLDGLMNRLGVKDREVEKWGPAWFEHVKAQSTQ